MWQSLSREHQRFLVRDELIGSIVVNFILNAGIAWYLFRAATSVPLWGWSSIAADALSTAFVMAMFSALIAAIIVRLRVRYGLLSTLPEPERYASAWLRRSTFVRAAILGVASIVLVAIPVVIVFQLVGLSHLSAWHFIWWKATFAAAVGALVTPLLGWWELVAVSRALSHK